MVVFSAIAAAVGAVVGAVGAAAGAVGAAGAAAGIGSGFATAAAVGGLALGAVGAYGQYSAAQKQASAQKKAEQLRKQQMALELRNQSINNIRQAQLARATNLVKGTSQMGGGAPFGSALANSTGAVESALGYQLDTTGQAGSAGYGIFNANAQYADASTSKSIFSGISNMGSALMGNVDVIDRVGTYLTGGALQNWGANTSVSYNG